MTDEYRAELPRFRVRYLWAVAGLLTLLFSVAMVQEWTYHHCLTRTADYPGRATWYCQHEPFGW